MNKYNWGAHYLSKAMPLDVGDFYFSKCTYNYGEDWETLDWLWWMKTSKNNMIQESKGKKNVVFYIPHLFNLNF